jgi:Fe-S-cluster containining protein
VNRKSSGLRFECTQCGKCCTSHGDYAHVYLNAEESGRIAEFLRMSVARFKREYTFVDEYGWRQLAFEGDRCVFLDEAGRCTIYSVHPTQCRTFPFWPEFVFDGEWSEEVRELCEGVGQGPRYTLAEAEKRMLEFIDSEED